MNKDKQSIRAHVIAQRKQLSASEWEQAAKNLAQQAKKHKLLSQHMNIALYCAVNQEMGTQPLMTLAWQQGINVYLPLCDFNTGHLNFVLYQEGDELITNAYGIPEPINADKAVTPPGILDLICLPLVASDPKGNRLGMGAGFYDKTFAFLQNTNQNHATPKPLLVGIGYEFQYHSKVPSDPWDVPLHAMLTDKNYYKFN